MDMNASDGSGIDQVFGANLREARTLRGMTQENLARAMQVKGFDFHQATVYKIESGKRSVSVGESFALAKALDTPIDELTRSRHVTLDSELVRLDLEALKLATRLKRIRDAAREIDPLLEELLAKAEFAQTNFERPDGEIEGRYIKLREAREAIDTDRISAFLEGPETKAYQKAHGTLLIEDYLF
jgi:transcriptional regulator with XRE-family HTH domain